MRSRPTNKSSRSGRARPCALPFFSATSAYCGEFPRPEKPTTSTAASAAVLVSALPKAAASAHERSSAPDTRNPAASPLQASASPVVNFHSCSNSQPTTDHLAEVEPQFHPCLFGFSFNLVVECFPLSSEGAPVWDKLGETPSLWGKSRLFQ